MHRKDRKRRTSWCSPCGQLVRDNHGPRCARFRNLSRARREAHGWVRLGFLYLIILVLILSFIGVLFAPLLTTGR